MITILWDVMQYGLIFTNILEKRAAFVFRIKE
jgi:hypothetical protein